MSAQMHDFPADVATLAACREVLRCEGSTPDQIAVACDYLDGHSADYTDIITVRAVRRAMAADDAHRVACDDREVLALRWMHRLLIAGWLVTAAAVAWRLSMGAV
jgi:hypothetical protein